MTGGAAPHGAAARRFWTAYAAVYDAAWDSPLTATVAERVAGYVTPGPVTVDVGCGTGLIGSVLSRRGHRVVGVDSSKAMACRARRLGRVDSAVVASAERTGLADGCASAVSAVNVLHVVDHPGRVLDEVVRLCAPGARIALVWPTDAVDAGRLRRAEAQLGWGAGRSTLAAGARSLVSVPGALLGIRKHAAGTLGAVVREAVVRHRLTTVAEETYGGSQHLCVLQVPGA